MNKYKTVLIKEGENVFVDEWKHEKRETEARIKRDGKFFKGKVAIEVGGPSESFTNSGFFPLYRLLSGIDNYNFSDDTFWLGSIPGGSRVVFNDDSSDHYYQHIGEATDLPVESNTYKVALMSHTLEHVTNPLEALFELKRVLKSRGILLLVMPYKGATPDHLRPTTTKNHILEDYMNDSSEEDLTHLEEILLLHDLSRDPWVSSFEAFKKRSEDNINNRCLHHHVFDETMLRWILNYTGFRVLSAEMVPSCHIVIIARLKRKWRR